jgi:hypothetical protein
MLPPEEIPHAGCLSLAPATPNYRTAPPERQLLGKDCAGNFFTGQGSRPDFPIWIFGSRTARFSCPLRNEIANGAATSGITLYLKAAINRSRSCLALQKEGAFLRRLDQSQFSGIAQMFPRAVYLAARHRPSSSKV